MIIKTDYSKTFSYARMQNGIPDGWDGNLGDQGIYKEVRTDDPLYTYAYKEMADGLLHTFKSEEASMVFLDAIRKEAKHSLEENGANTLYLAAGGA